MMTLCEAESIDGGESMQPRNLFMNMGLYRPDTWLVCNVTPSLGRQAGLRLDPHEAPHTRSSLLAVALRRWLCESFVNL